MITLKEKVKLVSINLLLAILSSIIISELFFKIIRPKFPMEVFGKSYRERLNKAKKDSVKNKNLTLVVGDSFAHHEIGTNGNFFDSVFNCKEQLECNYHNLAQSGVGLPFYWNSILSVLSERKKESETKIIIGIYLGNDIPFIDPSKSSEQCNKVHILSEEMISQYNDNWTTAIKRKLPSILFLARSLKSSLGIAAKKNINDISSNAQELRFYRSDPNQNLLSINKLSSRLSPEILDKASKHIINPWEISLSLANPNYYDDLYNLSKKWSQSSVRCLTENVVTNIKSIERIHPKTDFIVLGIPDKFYWSRSSYAPTTKEYRELGYHFQSEEEINNIQNNPLSIFIKNSMKANQVKYIYIPELIDSEENIVDWFYYRDMHINTKGNQIISELLKKKIYENKKKVSF